MAAWKKAVLAALMGVFSAFAQVTVAEAAPGEDLLLALPQGEELTDLELAAIHGERTDIELGGGGGGLLWLAVERALSYLQSKYADAVNLAQRGITYVGTRVMQHPVAANLTFNGTVGGLASGLTSEKGTTAGKLTDAAIGTVVGLGTTLAWYGVMSFAARVAPPPTSRVIGPDPWTTWTINPEDPRTSWTGGRQGKGRTMRRVLPLLAKNCVLFPVLAIGWAAWFIYIRGGPAQYASWPWWRILLDVVLWYVVGIAIIWWGPEMVHAAAKRLAAKDETRKVNKS